MSLALPAKSPTPYARCGDLPGVWTRSLWSWSLEAACLPCVALARIAHRTGWARYSVVLGGLVALSAVEVVVSGLMLWHSMRLPNYTVVDTAITLLDVKNDPAGQSSINMGTIIGVCTWWGSTTGRVLVCLTWALRAHVRAVDTIPGASWTDGVVSVCCSSCAIAQMAAHVEPETTDTLAAFPEN